MWNCERCGAQMPDEAQTCSSCGAPAPESVRAGNTEPVIEAEAEVKQGFAASLKQKVDPLVLMFSVLALAVIAVIIIILMNLDENGPYKREAVVYSSREEIVEPTEPDEFADKEDGSANIVQGGTIMRYDGLIYYSDGDLSTVTPTGKETKIYDNQVHYLSVGDDGEEKKIFCCDDGDGSKLISLKLDGSDRKILDERDCYEAKYSDGWIYYSAKDGDKRETCRIRPDGSKKKVLFEGTAWYLTVTDKRIYFSNHEDGKKLVCMKKNGTEKKTYYDKEVAELCVVEDKLYFATDSSSRKIYKMDLNGKNAKKVSGSYAKNLNYFDGRLWYCDKKGKLYSCKTNGEDEKKELDRRAEYTNFAYDTFIYQDADKILYRYYLSELDRYKDKF